MFNFFYVDFNYVISDYSEGDDEITIDWPNKVIQIPGTSLTQLQVNPTPIYELNLNTFRLKLKDLEDDPEGIIFLKTHNHNPPFNLGDVTLARTVDIVNDYTITFEDEQYAVNLIGANTNLADRVNVNQVSVRSANSAGLVTSAAIEFGEYREGVTVDVVNGESGSVYPIGTLRRPVNNIPDARTITAYRGFTKIYIVGDITLDTGDDVENMILVGDDPSLTAITINTGASTQYAQFRNSTITGTLDGDAIFNHCIVQDITYVSGRIMHSWLQGVISLSAGATAHILNCFDGTIDNVNPPTIDCGGSGQSVAVRDYNGRLSFRNKTGASEEIIVDLSSGIIELESTVTAGNIRVRGVGELVDNSVGATVDDDLLSINSIWNYNEAGDTRSYIMLNEAWNLTGGDRLITNNREYFYDSSGDTLSVFVLLDESGDSTETNVYQRTKVYPV